MPVVPPRVAHRWPPSRAALAASPAPRGSPPHRRAARRRAARHGLDRRRRCRGGGASGVSSRQGLGMVRRGRQGGAGGDDFKRHFTFTGAKGRETLPQRVRRLLVHAGVGLVERQYLLATTGWGNGRGNGSQLAMTEDTCDHRCMCDGGHDAQGATSAKRTGPHARFFPRYVGIFGGEGAHAREKRANKRYVKYPTPGSEGSRETARYADAGTA